jgi:hypothetical protein
MGETTTTALTLVGGISWTLVYVLIILHSYRDKTYGMPFWALAFNFGWELIFSYVLVTEDPGLQLQLLVNRIWLVLDLFILVAYFIYGRKEWPSHLSPALFYPYSVLVLLIGYCFVYLLSVELEHSEGMYAAFIQNLMMSWLFIAMLNHRKSTAGQSVAVAVCKLVGTLAPTIIYGAQSTFVLFLGAGCFVADAVYLVLLIRMSRRRITV